MILVAFGHSKLEFISLLYIHSAWKDCICFEVSFLELSRLLAKITHIQVPETQGPNPNLNHSLIALAAYLSLPLTSQPLFRP